MFYKKKIISGTIVGFDEFMNLVVDDAYEILVSLKKIKIGKVLIRGDSVMLIHQDPLYKFS